MCKREKLTKEERIIIRRMKRLRCSNRDIALQLGRHHTSISRELKRNLVDPNTDYFEQAQLSQEQAHQRRAKASKSKMRLKTESIRWYVVFHLEQAQWSPEIISGKLKTLGSNISHEAIYQFIYEERPDLRG